MNIFVVIGGNDELCVPYPNTAVYNLAIILSAHAPVITITQP
jgi:hypothetical protein